METTSATYQDLKGNVRGFLCGYFQSDKAFTYLTGHSDLGWTRKQIDRDQFKDWCTLYYESYVESVLDIRRTDSDKSKTGGSHIYNKISYFVNDLSVPFRLKMNEFADNTATYTFILNKIHIFNFPYNFVLFAIEVEAQDIPLDRSSKMLLSLREVSRYSEYRENTTAEAYLNAIEPLLDIYRCSNGSDGYNGLVMTGGKFKLFQIVTCNDCLGDDLLFDLGFLNRIGTAHNPSDINCPSENYYNSIIAENSMSIFNNWKILALFDTFTVLGQGNGFSADWWSENYFRMVYIHSLFQKFLLFDLNQKFRTLSKSSEMRQLTDEMKEKEKYYAFPAISYNFLPQMIYEKTNFGLGVDKEREELHKYIEQENLRQRESSDRKLSKAVLCLTIFAISSAIYDLVSLIRDWAGIEIPSCGHKIIVSAVVLFFIAILCLVYIINIRNNK